METGPAASLSNTHVPFSFSAVSVVGHGRWRNEEKKKKKKKKNTGYTAEVVEYLDRELRFEEYFFFEKIHVPREIEGTRKKAA